MIRKLLPAIYASSSFSFSLPILRFSTFNKTKRTYYSPLHTPPRYTFATLPKHDVLTMPALSPTMSEGKILKWLKNVGDQVESGDIICEIETDKATVGFEVMDKGYIAQIKNSDDPIAVGTPVAVVVKKKDFLKDFQGYSFNQQATSQKKAPAQPEQPAATTKPSSSSSYPRHNLLKMPALSPTMTEGKVVKWNIKEGEPYSEGDPLCEIETDKATVAFEASEKGVLAKKIAVEGSNLKVGEALGVSVRKTADADKFANFTLQSGEQASVASSSEPKAESKESSSSKQVERSTSSGDRVFASPAAKTLANEKGLNLGEIGSGSGPNGRIIRQDVETFTPVQKSEVQEVQTSSSKPSQTKSSPSPKVEVGENPFEEISVNNMRKTIAARLTESKTTIPHYYINCAVEMDAVTTLRAELNKNEKENGVKISVNDIMVKAMALALRDYPVVNSQWHGTFVKRFKYADVSVAVATEGGLITPIVYKADTLGLLEISRRTKDVAKRAREGKLDPKEYIGGTSTISNLGMFGINTVTSVINPPQATILGVGKTEKKLLFDETSTDPNKPYRVAEVCELIVSADHRVVDGAVAAQWVTRIKKYLENPTLMLL